jgi:ribosomal protein S12 methylthiotransferase
VPARFLDLARALGELGVWVRLHYVYPYPHVDEVIPLMAEGKVLPYLDIPFQHASPRVLTAMKRPAAREKTLARIARWREICPDIAIRSTFIVGFPGETDAEFDELMTWLAEAKLDRVGCFRFEPVAGAAANALPDPVPDDVKDNRWHRLMRAQQEISAGKLRRKVGRRFPVLVDESAGRTAKGRSPADAPEIDGSVHLQSRLPIRAGEIVTARIDRADAYDLYGQVV